MLQALRDELREAGRERAMPPYFSAQMHVLHDCNLRCSHCYDIDHARLKMPSTVEIKRRIDAVYALGADLGVKPDIHLSGGEPTVRKDIVEIVRHIFAVHDGDALLFTNGTLMTRTLAEQLRDAGLRWLQISMEGPRELNDEVRGPGVFDKAMACLHLAIELGFRVTVSITVTRRNWPLLPAFVADLDPLGLHFHIREVLPLGGGTELIALTRDERRAFAHWAVQYDGESSVGVEDPVHCSVAPQTARRESGCVAGRNHLCIDVDGAVFPCRPLAYPVGHVDDLHGAWHHPDMVRLRNRDLEGNCGRCELRWHCGGCRVHGLAAGNLFAGDERCFAEETGVLMPPWVGRAVIVAEKAGRAIHNSRVVARSLVRRTGKEPTPEATS